MINDKQIIDEKRKIEDEVVKLLLKSAGYKQVWIKEGKQC
jgi:transcription initiation factor TFIID subunit TAF12